MTDDSHAPKRTEIQTDIDRFLRGERTRAFYSPASPIPKPTRSTQSIEALTQGEWITSEGGKVYSIPTLYDMDYQHGSVPLTDWLDSSLSGASSYTQDHRFNDISPAECLFLDTETTGLGSGACAFLVGIGYFTADQFVVRQYFLTNPDEEPVMLHDLNERVGGYKALVTFNGRSFDVPLLNSRYTLNRQRSGLTQLAHFDLLTPARRLWKRRLESCRLANLETEVLGIDRTEDDIPGMLIPMLYQEYLLTGDARHMPRILYHNLIDVLSMVSLGAKLCQTYSAPTHQRLPGKDWLSLAKWYATERRFAEADQAFHKAFQAARLDSETLIVLQFFTEYLKKQGRLTEAVVHWETWAALQPLALDPRLALAKYHEWTSKQYDQAMAWTESALNAASTWGASALREETVTELTHRLERLRGKKHV
jgi:uncharacterized protein YprB with RNaseH-like and TPR domain